MKNGRKILPLTILSTVPQSTLLSSDKIRTNAFFSSYLYNSAKLNIFPPKFESLLYPKKFFHCMKSVPIDTKFQRRVFPSVHGTTPP